ncbi:6-phosphogluconolactonase [Flavobacterium sp. GA093]|uniref:6-phosphogluconolactonase n=1 Tax=Flavobacterium hydrocarbonoxydans TaxID=2683249 RepID=A0A6I4NUS4_9FLAO|nr:6-phosphogluconolactonase [Flavobacterium hydrocarbonoxydans]MWB95439.1 6-phosphogluconolactonase [Flavobacterium hydrocarbonoxydans]
MEILVYNTTEELNHDLADYVIEIAKTAIEKNNRFNFVLTGGNSPKVLYTLLATEYKDKIDWNKVFFFFGDERNVPATDDNYNGLMAKKSFFDILQTPENQIFYVNTALTPEEAAVDYKTRLDNHFDKKEIVFDLILLGMGDDAHTASIFPNTTLVGNTEATVAAVFVEKLNTHRISLTAPLINKAENIAFLVFGDNKAEALQHVLRDEQKDFSNYPSQLINPVNGKLTWFTDEAAARLL